MHEELGQRERNQTWQPYTYEGDSVKKRSIVYTTSLVSSAREKSGANERIDATGTSAMFCDYDDK